MSFITYMQSNRNTLEILSDGGDIDKMKGQVLKDGVLITHQARLFPVCKGRKSKYPSLPGKKKKRKKKNTALQFITYFGLRDPDWSRSIGDWLSRTLSGIRLVQFFHKHWWWHCMVRLSPRGALFSWPCLFLFPIYRSAVFEDFFQTRCVWKGPRPFLHIFVDRH